MIEILLVILLGMTIVIVIIFVGLLLQHKKLKQEYRVLEAIVERNSKDIAGLCSAAVTVDNRMLGNDQLLKGIAEKLTKYEERGYEAGNTTQPYHSAIQKIHQGATAEELVKECGVSRDEAMLLIRLHRSDNKTKDVAILHSAPPK